MNTSSTPLLKLDLTGIGILLALTAAFYFIALQPLLDRQSIRQSQNAQLADKRRQATQINSQMSATRAQVAGVKEMASKSIVQLHGPRHLNARTADIMKAADECGLQVHEIRPQTVISRECFDVIPIQLVGTGSYKACARFVHDLHKAFLDIGVNAFDMVGNPQKPDEPASFSFTIWWHIAPSMTADVPIPPGK